MRDEPGATKEGPGYCVMSLHASVKRVAWHNYHQVSVQRVARALTEGKAAKGMEDGGPRQGAVCESCVAEA